MSIWVKAACHKSLYYSTATCYSWYPHKIIQYQYRQNIQYQYRQKTSCIRKDIPHSMKASTAFELSWILNSCNHQSQDQWNLQITQIDFRSWWVKNVKRCDWADCSFDGTRLDGFHWNWFSTRHTQLLHCQGWYLSWGSNIAFGDWKGQLTKYDKITFRKNYLNGQKGRFNINHYSSNLGFKLHWACSDKQPFKMCGHIWWKICWGEGHQSGTWQAADMLLISELALTNWEVVGFATDDATHREEWPLD